MDLDQEGTGERLSKSSQTQARVPQSIAWTLGTLQSFSVFWKTPGHKDELGARGGTSDM